MNHAVLARIVSLAEDNQPFDNMESILATVAQELQTALGFLETRKDQQAQIVAHGIASELDALAAVVP